MFQHLPREQHRLDLGVGGVGLGHDLQILAGRRPQVPLLDQPAARERLLGQSVRAVAGGEVAHVEHAQVVLVGQYVDGRVGVPRRDDDLLERLDDRGGGVGVTSAVERDNPAERAHRVGRQGVVVGVREGVGGRTPRGVGVFDHRRRGGVELPDQVERRVGVVVVVVRQRLRARVQLGNVDHAGRRGAGVGVDRGRLVGVLPVPERRYPVAGDGAALREVARLVALDRDRRVPRADPLVDPEPVLGEPPDRPGVRRELRVVEHSSFQRRGVVVGVDGHGLLGDDRTVVDDVGHHVDGTPRHAHAGVERLLVGVVARERGQKRRVDVERRGNRLQELGGEDPHVAVEADQVDVVTRQGVDEPAVVGLGRLPVGGFDRHGGDPAVGGGVQHRGVGVIRDDHVDSRPAGAFVVDVQEVPPAVARQAGDLRHTTDPARGW